MNYRLIVGNINRELEAAYVWSLKEGFQKSVWQDVRTPVSKPVPDERNGFGTTCQQSKHTVGL